MRDTVVRTLIELAKENKNIELLTGDLGFGVLKPYWETLPDQFTNAGIAEQLGIPKENIFILQAGDVLELDDKGARVAGHVQTGAILVDGLGVGDVGNIVLRDRQHLAEDGILIVVLTLAKGTNQLLAGPDIVSRGFVYVRESEGLMEEAKEVLNVALEGCLNSRNADWSKIKLVVRDTMNEFIWKRTKRRPMILPIIMDVNV